MVTEALTRFARDYAGRDRQDILRELRKTTGKTVATRAIGGDGNKPPARQDDDVARKKDDPRQDSVEGKADVFMKSVALLR